MSPMETAVLVVRVLLGGLLLVAGGLKVGHSAELAASIAGFRLLPAEIAGPLALALPYFEFCSEAISFWDSLRVLPRRWPRPILLLRGRRRVGRRPAHPGDLRLLRPRRLGRRRLAARRVRSHARGRGRLRCLGAPGPLAVDRKLRGA